MLNMRSFVFIIILQCRDTTLHPDMMKMESNNNVAGVVHQDRVYIAWRTAPLHFAGRDTRFIANIRIYDTNV